MVEQAGSRSPEERIQALEAELKEIKEKLWCSRCEVPFGATLSDRDIKRLLEKRRIIIDPLPDLADEKILDTCKVDLHLGREALVIDITRIANIDLSQPIPKECFRKIDILKEEKIIILANEVLVAITMEQVKLPEDIIARIEGKSSVARHGLSVQLAALFDAGWEGYPVLELHNMGKVGVTAYYGSPICAMSFTHLSSPTLKSYSQRETVRYRNQTGAKI